MALAAKTSSLGTGEVGASQRGRAMEPDALANA